MWNVRICDGSVRLSFSLKLHNLHTIRWHKRVHIKMDCTVICIINDDGKDRILTSLHYVKDPLHVCTYKRTESKSATKIEIERLQIANEKKNTNTVAMLHIALQIFQSCVGVGISTCMHVDIVCSQMQHSLTAIMDEMHALHIDTYCGWDRMHCSHHPKR